MTKHEQTDNQWRAKSFTPPIIFNNNNVLNSPWQKHLVLVLDRKLTSDEHVNQKIHKCNRIIELMRRLSLTLSRKQLLTICKTFVRSHLDYAGIVYDKPFNDTFKEKLEKLHYFPAFVIIEAMKGTFMELLNKELGLEFLCDRRWYRKLFFFFKIVKGLAASYFQSYLLSDNEIT